MGMRVLILALSALSILGVVVCADAAKANPSTTARDLSAASVEPAPPADEAPQAIPATLETEGQIGLDKRKRREVQRRLNSLGFTTKISGKFDEPTRAVIARWQEARGYPQTGFLDTQQHDALRNEITASTQSGSSSGRPGGGAHHHRGGGGGGGPVRLIGGMVGGLFGRR
jgi:peptidoglycan hydrolase-like protein with peptidoglycan-binding domain